MKYIVAFILRIHVYTYISKRVTKCYEQWKEGKTKLKRCTLYRLHFSGPFCWSLVMIFCFIPFAINCRPPYGQQGAVMFTVEYTYHVIFNC